MIYPKPHEKEASRLLELESYSILDTVEEEDFDNLTSIAAAICGTKISLISLIDDKRQWFKSHHGLAAKQTPKDYAFCAHALNDPSPVFEVRDAREDKRFFDNPLVTGDPHVIFYAGVSLISQNGLPLGTLCVIDDHPKKLTSTQINSLNALSKQVMNLFELRRTKFVLERTLTKLEETNQDLERFALIAAHDLKSPLNNIASFISLFKKIYDSKIDKEGLDMLDMIQNSSTRLKKLIDGLLQYSRSESMIDKNKTWIKPAELIHEMKELLASSRDITIDLNSPIEKVFVNRTVLYHVLSNLITNAIKYNDKTNTTIKIQISETDNYYTFEVKDNGPGIPEAFQDEIFELFKVLSSKDKFGQTGSGIGLAMVKKLVEKSDGQLSLKSEAGVGSTFIFTLAKTKDN